MSLLINIDVPDLDTATQFYCNAFDLKVNRCLGDDVVELTGLSATIYLLKKDSGSICSACVTETRRYNRHWTPIHIDIVVNDLQSAAARVINAGALVESECGEWRGSKCMTFSDPFGHGFCLIEFEAGSYV